MPESDRRAYFRNAWDILSCSFRFTWDGFPRTIADLEAWKHYPSAWDEARNSSGWCSWDKCSAVLPHVRWLIKLSQERNIRIGEPLRFAKLAFRMGIYLWEIEQPSQAMGLFEYGLGLDSTSDMDSYTVNCTFGKVYRFCGHAALDMAQPRRALQFYQKSLAIAEDQEPDDEPLTVADLYDSIACCYTEMGDTDKALEYLHKAAETHKSGNSNASRTKAIYAMTYLRENKFKLDKASNSLHECWELQNLSQDQVEASKHPKHSGDVMLLSRIKKAQDHEEGARNLVLRAIEMRQQVYGGSSLQVADSMFFLSRMVEDRDAARLLKGIVHTSKGSPNCMQGQLARALWFLAALEEKRGNAEEAHHYRKRAEQERSKIEAREVQDESTDDGFMSLTTWMLW